jgi:Family of unknown function (DUF6011)
MSVDHIDNDLDDSLDDMLGGSVVPTRTRPTPPANYTPPTYFEPCGKCCGTGQTRWGVCFRCKGRKGKTFKTAPAQRAKNREQAAARDAKKREEYIEVHRDVVEWINRSADRPQPFAFAVAMREALANYGSLTDNQLAACERLVAKDKVRDAERAAERAAREAAAPAVDVTKLESAFNLAKSKARKAGAMGIKRLTLRLQSGEHALTFSPGSPGSQWEGMIFAKEGDKKLGWIKDGKFTARFQCSDAEQAAVLDACNDPLKAALAYGQKWSACAVCGRELTNNESIQRGIGPICAERYGW